MVEQRYQAVREVLDAGATITEVAKHYGVDRRTLHRWLTRYANGDLKALVTQSTRPDTCPHQMDPAIEARLVERRRTHPTWGPRTLATKLRAEFGSRAPSRAAIYRALVRHQLIVPVPRRVGRRFSNPASWAVPQIPLPSWTPSRVVVVELASPATNRGWRCWESCSPS